MMIAALDSVRREWVAVGTASSLAGVQAAVAGGLGVTLLGRSFVQEGMQILRAPDLWPALPMTEVTVLGEERAADLVQPLVTFLSESLAGHDGLTLAALPAVRDPDARNEATGQIGSTVTAVTVAVPMAPCRRLEGSFRRRSATHRGWTRE